jgi:hypothetical protein
MTRIYSYYKNKFDKYKECKNIFYGKVCSYAEVNINNLQKFLDDDCFISDRLYMTSTPDYFYKIKNKTGITPDFIKKSKNNNILYLYYSKKDCQNMKKFFEKKKSNRTAKKKNKNKNMIDVLYNWVEQLIFSNNIEMLKKKWIKENPLPNRRNKKFLKEKTLVTTYIQTNKVVSKKKKDDILNKKKEDALIKKKEDTDKKIIVEKEDEDVIMENSNLEINLTNDSIFNFNIPSPVKNNLDIIEEEKKSEINNKIICSEVISLTDDKIKNSNQDNLLVKESTSEKDLLEKFILDSIKSKDFDFNNELEKKTKEIELEGKKKEDLNNNSNDNISKIIKRSRSEDISSGYSPEKKTISKKNFYGTHKQKNYFQSKIKFSNSNYEDTSSEDKEKVININLGEKKKEKFFHKIPKKNNILIKPNNVGIR